MNRRWAAIIVIPFLFLLAGCSQVQDVAKNVALKACGITPTPTPSSK